VLCLGIKKKTTENISWATYQSHSHITLDRHLTCEDPNMLVSEAKWANTLSEPQYLPS